MATLSNIAMAIAGGLTIFVLLTGPTHYVMSGITGSIGDYFARVVPHGFKTYAFFDEKVTTWFQSWTLTFMVWWFAWAPFVGVFIARISRGRTIREYLFGVVLVPTFFSIFWFGVFGSVGFYEVLTDHYRNGSGSLFICGDECGKRLFCTFDVRHRWRPEPFYKDEAYMGRNIGSPWAGYDPVE
jgi:choline-glycine betaine transporter